MESGVARDASLSLTRLRTDTEESSDEAITRLLAAARAHFAMDVAFVSEFAGGQRVFRFVDAKAEDSIVQVDGADPLEESYCQRVVDGRLPEVITDATRNPEAARLPVTNALPVGAHLSVPIRLRDGAVFGTLCCFKADPDETLSARDGAVMHLFASLVAGYLQQTSDRSPADDVLVDDAEAEDDELRELQFVAWPAVICMILCTLYFSLEHLTARHLTTDWLEHVFAVLGVSAVAVLVGVGIVGRGVSARLVRASAELDRRDTADRAGQSAFDLRRRQIVEVLEARETMRMVFQPVFDLDTEQVVGHEALARFAGDRPPDVWFAEAHDVGLGVELELLAVTEAIRTFEGPTGYLAVNVSPAALGSAALQDFLAKSPDAARLVLELTEHAVVDDYDLIASCVTQLRQLGTRLAVDDAGSGFASMRHIVDLAPDIVKLDRSIVDRVDSDTGRAALVQSLTQFATGIGATVVAEGIERPEELAACRRLGVHCGQGYLLGRPSPAHATAPL